MAESREAPSRPKVITTPYIPHSPYSLVSIKLIGVMTSETLLVCIISSSGFHVRLTYGPPGHIVVRGSLVHLWIFYCVNYTQ